MIHRKGMLIAAALACALWTRTATAATDGTAAVPVLTAPTDFQAIDKPNDNGTSVFLTWKKMPCESPDVLYDFLMAEDQAPLVKRLDELVSLGVIDAARKAQILAEIGITDAQTKVFVPQFTLSAQKPSQGAALAPPCSDRSAYPASFGFSAANKAYHAVEVNRFFNRKDIVLHIPVRWNRALVNTIRTRKLVNRIVDSDDPDKRELRVETLSDALERGRTYFFKVNVRRGDTVIEGTQETAAAPLDNWFAWHKVNLLIALFVLATIIMSFAKIAKRNPNKLFIRRLAGLDAVEEALGRAAEMGKPVYFCHGPGDLSSVVTISAINLLGKIAERVGEYGTELKVTCLDYLVMQVSQEMVRDAYTRVGRSDAYRDDDIMFVTGDTFAYSAAVGGMMIREKAGTAFFFGRFGSESLLLSETGAVTKAIQIAGTDSFTQIPFFITTCDYTLIGEEMYAGSAYLSREPRLVGAVKGQDAVKAITMTVIVIGTILASAGMMWFAHLFWPLT